MLSITKEEFLVIYKGLKICDHVDLFYSMPTSDIDLIENYLPSKLWRLNNIYSIVNKHGTKIKFVMNRAQHRVYAASLRHPRNLILKSRQQGISTFWLVSFCDDAATNNNLSIGLMAQGKDEASTLLERIKILWTELLPDFKRYWNLDVIVDNTTEFSLSSGSKVFVRTSFRSTTLQRLHVSEMGKIANTSPEKANEVKSGTLQALAPGNLGIIESTAEGDNLFKEMWDTAYTFTGEMSPLDFAWVFLSWLDDPDCVSDVTQIITPKTAEYFASLEKELGFPLSDKQKNFWIIKQRELGDKIWQEYPATPKEAFKVAKNGAYYAEAYVEFITDNNREIDNLYDANLDVEISTDLGRNDTNVLCVFQRLMDEYRIIAENADTNKPVKYYCDWIKEQPWFYNLRTIYLPHDAAVRSMTDNKTRAERFEEEMAYITINGQKQPYNRVSIVVLEKGDKQDGIDGVRAIMSRLWIDRTCTYLKKCFLNYRKEWNEKMGVYRNEPLHDEYSNGADAIRYMVDATGSVGADTTSSSDDTANGDMDV